MVTEAEVKESLAAESLIQVAPQRPAWSRLSCQWLGDRSQRLPQNMKAGKWCVLSNYQGTVLRACCLRIHLILTSLLR